MAFLEPQTSIARTHAYVGETGTCNRYTVLASVFPQLFGKGRHYDETSDECGHCMTCTANSLSYPAISSDMMGKKRQRAPSHDDKEARKEPPKKLKPKGEMEAVPEAHALLPPVHALFTSPPVTRHEKKQDQAFMETVETPCFHTPCADFEESTPFMKAAKQIMNANGKHVSDKENEVDTNPSSHRTNGPVVSIAEKPTAARVKSKGVILVSLLAMTCVLFAALWFNERLGRQQEVYELNQKLLQADVASRRHDRVASSMQKDLEAWMGRTRQLEREKRDMTEDFKRRLAQLEGQHQ